MLFGLRHPTVVGCNNQEREIDRSDSGDHVADEIFVSWNIDNPDVNLFALRSGEIEFGKSEIDRNATSFFFRQTIRIGSSQRFDERALAMVDMAGGGENEICHRVVQAVRMASMTRSS